VDTLRKNRTLLITLAILFVLFLLAIQGMSTSDWVITMLRGISVGAITFLVASGLSLIFGLLDVLNLAHGTLFMIGAYVGWTVYVRPDTFVDVLPPVLLLASGILSRPILDTLLDRCRLPQMTLRIGAWLMLALALLVAILAFGHWPVAKWDPGVPANIPASNSLALDQATMAGLPRPIPEPAPHPGATAVGGFILGGICLAASLSGFARQRHAVATRPFSFKILVLPLGLLLAGLAIYLANDGLTYWLYGLSTIWIFLIAVLFAILAGALLGGLMEMTLIRPLYSRPIYQLMLTLGVGVAGIELVRAIWGSPEFTMPKPAVFQGAGSNCPATSLAGWLQYNCSTFSLLGGRLRTYNEIFVILVGLIVLVGVWLLLQRSRIGMIIRAGVQDSSMVEALGINVRVVFTFVFALGAALATLGGVVAAPSMGLSPYMGETLLISALIALAIGGLTSFPGAAAGSLLVGLLQQYIIKYGQIGIKIPFTGQVLKPTPPLVPASTVLLMVIILLAMPQGLFGRRE
jgi:branched-chain amino acid transport system permease protein